MMKLWTGLLVGAATLGLASQASAQVSVSPGLGGVAVTGPRGGTLYLPYSGGGVTVGHPSLGGYTITGSGSYYTPSYGSYSPYGYGNYYPGYTNYDGNYYPGYTNYGGYAYPGYNSGWVSPYSAGNSWSSGYTPYYGINNGRGRGLFRILR